MRHPTRGLLGIGVLALALTSGCSSWTAPGGSDDDFGAVADFVLVDQDGRNVGRPDLLGKVWVAAFVFTRCAGPCSQITGNLAHLQHDLAGQPDVALVSVTVDPEHDTPAVLKTYATTFGAEPGRWHFLTGEPEAVYRLIRESFHLAVEPTHGTARTPGNEVTHSTRLALVDHSGHIRGYFDGTTPDDLRRLRTRVAALVREKP
jgi:cytochrome oxidase Cu insertion factor (SCO1/SenC/PrrC family)